MDYKFCDTHNDFLTELPIEELEAYINECTKNNVERICASYWTTKKDKDEILGQIEKRAEILRKTNDKYLLHIEDLWWVQDENTLENLIKIKPFSCSLTWNDQNLLAGGTNSKTGLTAWGKHCLLKLQENGIILDTAHLNRQSFRHVTNLVPQKIFCSHTGFYGIKKHKRNLTDHQIDTIVSSNGFVGLFFFDKCVQTSQNFSTNDIIDNLNYFTTRWGFDNIGLGTDFYGIENYPNNLRNYSELQNLTKTLSENGYTQTQINKICYLNFANFLNEHCPL